MNNNSIEIRMTSEQKRWIKQQAENENRTISDFVRVRIFNSSSPGKQRFFSTDDNQSESFRIRCTKAERNILEERAKDAQQTIPEFIKQVILYQEPIINKKILKKIYRELYYEGNNLNQLVHYIHHRKQKTDNSSEINQILSETKTVLKNLNKAISATEKLLSNKKVGN